MREPFDFFDAVNRRVEALSARYAGKRIGIYAGEFGRLNGGIKEILGSLPIVGILRLQRDESDQGYRTFSEVGEFLRSTDLCLSFSQDRVSAVLSHNAAAIFPGYRVIGMLDEANPESLIASSDVRMLTVSDAEVELRLVPEHFQKTLDASRELATLHLKRPQGDEEPPYNPMIKTMVREGKAVFVCPFCGKTCESNTSLPAFVDEFSQRIFYRFSCCRVWYPYISDAAVQWHGIYFPENESVVSLLPGDSGEGVARALSDLKRFSLMLWDETHAYVFGGERTGAVALGFLNNVGHCLTDEMLMLEVLRKSGDLRHPAVFYLGSRDFFSVGEIFPEISQRLVRILPREGTLQQRQFELFRAVVTERRFLCRVSWHAGFPRTLSKRLMTAAHRHCSADLAEKIAAARMHRRIVAITLRSHMRLWRSQRVGVQTLIARLLADESDTFFVFDGRPEDAQVYRDIVECLPAGVRYADALHCSLWETLCWFKAADLGVMPHGAGCAMNIVADTPALLHTHASWQQLSIDDYANRASPGRDPRSSQRVDVTWEDETQDVYCRDYEIDIDDLCVKAIAMLRTFPSEAVILCGGKGTRLLSVVSDRPKPMANIFDRPFLDFVIDHFAAAGVRRFVLCAGHMGDQIEAYYRENPRGLDITVVTERELLGTAGAVKAAQAHIRSDVFFVANGDTLCPLDVRACAAQHRQHDAYATVAVSRVTQRSDAGVITRDGAGRIVAFDEKRPCDEAFVNAGVYLLTRSVFDRIPAGEKRSLEYDVFPAMAREGLLCAYTTDACFYDIGTPERLAVFKEYAAAQQKDCASRAHKL